MHGDVVLIFILLQDDNILYWSMGWCFSFVKCLYHEVIMTLFLGHRAFQKKLFMYVGPSYNGEKYMQGVNKV